MLQPKNSLTLAPKWLAYAFSAAALIVLWQSTALGNLLGGDEPLSPEVAFVPSFVETTSNHISVKFDIEDGYYLYRDKLKFNVESDQSGSQSLNNILASTPIELSTPNFPPAKILDDQFFGEMAIYRNQVRIDIPYTQFSSVDSGMLEITYQGCADIGLCYPPTKAKVSFDPPPSKASGDAPIILAELNTLGGVGAEQPSSLASPISGNDSGFNIFGESSAQDELLPPELAYLPQIVSATGSNIVVRWFIEPGYYLYRDKLSFSLEQLPDVSLVHVQLDEGVDQYDEFYGDVKVFRHSADAVLTIDSSRSTSGKLDGQLLINYQGCADIGVCFPPSVTELPVNFEATESNRNSDPVIATLGTSGSTSGTQGGNAALVASIGNNASAASNTGGVLANAQTPQQTAPIAESEQDRLFNFLSSSGLWLTVATFFGFGLLLAFTPCVLPMVPILSSLIVGQGDKMSTMRAFQLSLIYVLVMASTYALVGIIVGLSGYNVQAFLQNPWVLSFIAVLFVLLSLSMFGFYELQMPVSLQEKLTKWSNKQVGGQVSGVAAMGFISTLIVGPCITAPLAGALIYIAKTGDAVIGGAALFALGLGMGAPLLLIGTSAGKFVPKAGTWMDAVKHVFGIIMIAMAIYMISRFIPTTVTMLLFGVLAVMSGIYWGAADSVTKESTGCFIRWWQLPNTT